MRMTMTMMWLCLAGRGLESEWLVSIQENEIDFRGSLFVCLRAFIARIYFTLSGCLWRKEYKFPVDLPITTTV